MPNYFWYWHPLQPIFSLPSSEFLDPSLLFIMSQFPINKQFSIDSFLDWEGLHWVFAHLNRTTATHSLILSTNNDNYIKCSNHFNKLTDGHTRTFRGATCHLSIPILEKIHISVPKQNFKNPPGNFLTFLLGVSIQNFSSLALKLRGSLR